jgi:chromosome segregation ATPase
VNTPDERLARLEEQIRGVREDITELVQETNRARTRLHQLEGIAASFVDIQKENRRREAEQYQRLSLRIQLAGLLLAAAAILSPILVVLLARK